MPGSPPTTLMIWDRVFVLTTILRRHLGSGVGWGIWKGLGSGFLVSGLGRLFDEISGSPPTSLMIHVASLSDPTLINVGFLSGSILIYVDFGPDPMLINVDFQPGSILIHVEFQPDSILTHVKVARALFLWSFYTSKMESDAIEIANSEQKNTKPIVEHVRLWILIKDHTAQGPCLP